MGKRNQKPQGEEVRALMDAADVEKAISEALDEKLGTLIEAMQEQFKLMENQLKRTEDHVTDPRKFGNAGVLSRQAARAGMTRSEWLRHCERTGHDPLKMDRSIPNHRPSGGRPSGSGKKKAAKASSKKKRSKKTG